ncbi:MAG: archaeal flagellar protein FlaI [Thermoplasmata archaeon]|jgi:flagellar protein FlaI|nr:archaeal flagellar protein FlaI [Thermoplasmata archaeon]
MTPTPRPKKVTAKPAKAKPKATPARKAVQGPKPAKAAKPAPKAAKPARAAASRKPTRRKPGRAKPAPLRSVLVDGHLPDEVVIPLHPTSPLPPNEDLPPGVKPPAVLTLLPEPLAEEAPATPAAGKRRDPLLAALRKGAAPRQAAQPRGAGMAMPGRTVPLPPEAPARKRRQDPELPPATVALPPAQAMEGESGAIEPAATLREAAGQGRKAAALLPPEMPARKRRRDPELPPETVPLPPVHLAHIPAPGVQPLHLEPGDDGVTQVPPLPPGHVEEESAMLVPGRAWVRILLDETTQTHLYQVVEPVLSEDERKIFEFLRDTLIRTLEGRSSAGRETKDWGGILLEAARHAIKDHRVRISGPGQQRVEYHLLRDFLGFGPIDVMMRDPMIEDISCDGPGIPLYLFHRRYDSMRTTVVFEDEVELDRFVIRLAQRSGKHISVADPLLDATLPDGSRLQTTLSREITTRGSSFTIRKFRADPLTPPDLIRYGTLNSEMAAFMWFVMEMGASFLLAGGTASGKTTTLNAICQFIPPEKKIVSIEDTREINLSHENWIAGITRAGFGREGLGVKSTGAVDMYKLLESALRQRPEYLLVGEVRGAEALTLFQAMATGHAVYSTMHADSVTSAIYRLENEPINVPRMMLQTLDLVLIQGQARVKGRLVRRIKELSELVGFDPDTKEILSNTVFSWDPTEDKHVYLGKSYILEQVMQTRNLTEEQLLKEWRQRIEVLDWMVASGVRRYDEVASAVGAYYRDPTRFLERIRGKPA